jgi:hypothetical protein
MGEPNRPLGPWYVSPLSGRPEPAVENELVLR